MLKPFVLLRFRRFRCFSFAKLGPEKRREEEGRDRGGCGSCVCEGGRMEWERGREKGW